MELGRSSQAWGCRPHVPGRDQRSPRSPETRRQHDTAFGSRSVALKAWEMWAPPAQLAIPGLAVVRGGHMGPDLRALQCPLPVWQGPSLAVTGSAEMQGSTGPGPAWLQRDCVGDNWPRHEPGF